MKVYKITHRADNSSCGSSHKLVIGENIEEALAAFLQENHEMELDWPVFSIEDMGTTYIITEQCRKTLAK